MNEPAVIYARYSSDNQREESIDAQIRAIKEYIARNNYILVDVYPDEAKSATTDERPQFLKMIEDAKKGHFKYVIVHKLDRFARNRYDSAYYRKKLKDAGVRLLSVLEYLDDSPESVILESVLEGMAEYFSRNLSREVMKGLKETAMQGKHAGGLPPIGYDVGPDRTYIVNENEAVIIRRIYELFNSGTGYAAISNLLNESGFRTKKGREFSKTSIRDIILNEKYSGVYTFNKRTKKLKTSRACKDESEIIRIDGGVPPIVSKETYIMAYEKIKRGERGPRMGGERFYLLTGKVYCGECGSSYSGNGYRGQSKEYIYACIGREKNKSCTNKPIGQVKLEDHVINILNQKLFTEKAMLNLSKKIIESLSSYNSDHLKENGYLTNQLKKHESKKDRIFDLYTEGRIDKNDFSQKIKPIEDELAILRSRKAEMEIHDYSWVSKEKIMLYLYAMKENLNSGEHDKQRKVIETFVEKIIIYNDRIEAFFKIDSLFHSDDNTGVKQDTPWGYHNNKRYQATEEITVAFFYAKPSYSLYTIHHQDIGKIIIHVCDFFVKFM